MSQLEEQITKSTSRRSLLKKAVGSAAGASLAAVSLATPTFAHAFNMTNASSVTPIGDILTIARTAERLAVTFYTNGIKHASSLGVKGSDLQYLKAALVEEQIHELFFASAGGKVLSSDFSFPQGPQTFKSLSAFIATQQQLEGVFDSAFLSAIREFAQQGRADLAQISGQIACIEAEHRALGRAIANLNPADNWAFTPVLIGKVGDAPALVTKAGYLSPRSGNHYTYKQVSTAYNGVVYRTPYAAPSN